VHTCNFFFHFLTSFVDPSELGVGSQILTNGESGVLRSRLPEELRELGGQYFLEVLPRDPALDDMGILWTWHSIATTTVRATVALKIARMGKFRAFIGFPVAMPLESRTALQIIDLQGC
jgi:hypothetical protein